MKFFKVRSLLFLLFFLVGCATVTDYPEQVEAPISRAKQQEAQKKLSTPEVKTYKRRIAVARFSNETRYGRTLWDQRDEDLDPLGKQASDMLMSKLVASGKFLVFERQDLAKIKREQALLDLKQSNLVGVDTLIIGSVTEFGRSVGGKSGFLSSTKNQVAQAKVEIRLADVRSGHVFFSATGSGEVNTESGEIVGFGSRADYDTTLNDKAIAAAISDVLNELMSKLEERPWRTDILKLDGTQVFISGGKHQGITVGCVLAVMREGLKVKSQQSGFDIDLPPAEVGTIRVMSQFGDNEVNEGSVCEIINGSFTNDSKGELFVIEKKEHKQ
ncbi:MAG: curli production assembly/transport component CsgG family protein [Candidatus Brocadiaceae bacterium]|nr:curli production assembly/transport component CsgG family protein [Candidatus Brocadiaceae bacterium]